MTIFDEKLINLKPLPETRQPFYESGYKHLELMNTVRDDAELSAKVLEIQKQMNEIRSQLNAKYLWD